METNQPQKTTLFHSPDFAKHEGLRKGGCKLSRELLLLVFEFFFKISPNFFIEGRPTWV